MEDDDMIINTNALINVRSSTIKDVASGAGVSIATVSRVINGAESVSSDTRARVLTAIARLQFCPNPHAAQLGRVNRGIPRKARSYMAEQEPIGVQREQD